jgi:hypothetical protein
VDVGQAETPADDEDVGEALLDLAGTGVGRHVEILRSPSEHQVADRSAAEIGDEAHPLEAGHDPQRVGVDARPVDGMAGPDQDDGRGRRVGVVVEVIHALGPVRGKSLYFA